MQRQACSQRRESLPHNRKHQENDMRILGMMRATKESEAGAPPSPELMQRMGVFMEEVMKAGVLLATDGLHPSAKGKRVKITNGKVSITDGPFTESKELVASYALFEVKTMEEAVMWTRRFLEVLGEGECELRPIFDPADVAPFSPEQSEREEAWRKDMDQRLAKQ
jgi:hypothetical protein